MPIITLISDWGLKDHYIAAVKGAILRRDPTIQIIDITHQIEPFSLLQPAFVLRNAYHEFPEGTIHILGVNTVESVIQSHVAIYHKGHFFIGADNGIFSLAFGEIPEKIIVIDIPQDSDYFTFSTRDRFVKAACHLASGKPIEALGFQTKKINERLLFNPVVEQSSIKGKVIFIDGFENLYVNISKQLFDSVCRNREFSIVLRNSEYQVREIYTSYSKRNNPEEEGDLVALFGTTGFLEIALNMQKAASMLGVKVDDPVRIDFK